MNDKVLLCITCILEENHKNHELDSIINARNEEMKAVEKHQAKAEALKQKILSSINNIYESTQSLNKTTAKSVADITHFYNKIRKIINEREEKQQNKVKEYKEKEEASLSIQEKTLQSTLQKIQEQSNLYKDLSSQSPVQFLKSSNKRKQSIQETQIDETQQNISIQVSSSKFEFNKEKEVSSLMKIFSSYLKQDQSKQQTNNTQNYNSTPNTQKPAKINISPNIQPNTQQNVVVQPIGGLNTPVSNANKLQKNTPQQVRKDSKSSKSSNPQNMFSKEKDSIGSSQGQVLSTAGSSSKKQNQDFKSEDIFDDKQTQSNKQSFVKQSSSNNQEIRSQNKERQPNERENNRSASRDDQNYNSIGLTKKDSASKQQTVDSKNKRSPISMISLVSNPSNPSPQVVSSQTQNPKTPVNSQNSQNNLTGRGTPSAQMVKLQQSASPKQDPLKRQDQRQVQANFEQYAQQKSPHDNIGKKGTNQNDSYEMSDIPCNASEKNEEYQEQIANNSFKGEINQFLSESQHKQNIPSISSIQNQKQSSIDTPLSGINSLTSYTVIKLGGDSNETNLNKQNSSSNQNSNQFIYVFGGFTEGQQYTIDRFDIQRNAWEQYDIMPTNRSKFCSTVLMNGNILMIGGKQDSSRTSSIDEYNPRQKTFQKSSLQLTSPRSGFGAVYKNDMIYAIGGNDGFDILDTMELYDFVTKQVKQFPKMLEKRDELAVAYGLDGKIYAIGGFGGDANTCLNSVERYNPSLEKWEKIASLNKPRRALNAVTLPDGIYAIGGFDGSGYINTVEKYDEQLNQWVYVNNMHHGRCTSSALVSQNNQYIYVFGGFDNGPLEQVERYNVFKGTWEILKQMPNKRFMHCCQLIQQ